MVLFVFLIIYLFFVFFIRSYLLFKRTGINPLTFTKSDDAHGFNGKVFSYISVMEFIVVSIYAFGDKWYEFLLPFWYLELNLLVKIGWVLMVFSLVWIMIAQTNMANSWRIGIDEKNETELITNGLFSYSRNPIFFGVLLTNTGLFLIIPNAFTLLILIMSYVAIQTQVRLEENFLLKEFGENYKNYCNRVRRWM